MKSYLQPCCTVLYLESEDVITTSGPVASSGAYANDDGGLDYSNLF